MKDEWQLFDDEYLSRKLGGKKQAVDNTIKGEDPQYILNVDKEDYLEHLVAEYSVEPLIINFEEIYADTETVRGKTHYDLYFPVGGNLDLLRLHPEEFNGWSTTAHINTDETEFWIRLDIEEDNPDEEDINSAIHDCMAKVKENFGSVLSQIEDYNSELHTIAEKKFDRTKRNYLKDREIEKELDVPVNSRSDRADTFAIDPPEEREEIKVEKPDMSNTSPLEAIPTLATGTYIKILAAINDVGKGFERSPRLFIDREEEELRDYLLFFLEMNFEGSATGETFNNEGKTDILLRHEGNNVFIAECAWWNGKERFLNKISQLSDYLTWRDTKTAVILFTDNKSIERVHSQIKEGAKEHPQCKEFQEEKGKSWFQYEFYFPEDEERTIELAVIVFHFRTSD